MAGLLPLDEAQARLLALAEALPIETIAVAEAGGRWAASDIIASRSQPAADLSAMVGYAVRHMDLPGASRIIRTSASGQGFSGADRSCRVAGRCEAVWLVVGGERVNK